MKRIISIQDISCLGKCSLTAALPVISAMGIETCIVPTAVLSTHSQFKGFTFRDLTDDLDAIRRHWVKEGFSFDAIYTGYLGSERQIDLVSDYITSFKKENTKVIVDPAMADGGRLYAGFDTFFAHKMKSLCSKADVILPNISEAAIMLDMDYPGEDAGSDLIHDMLLKLSGFGAKVSVITGTTFPDGTIGYTGYDSVTGTFFGFGTPKVDYRSHGTGDLFASTFTGAWVRGASMEKALEIASLYTARSILNTKNDPERISYGVNFEAEIPYLISLIKDI